MSPAGLARHHQKQTLAEPLIPDARAKVGGCWPGLHRSPGSQSVWNAERRQHLEETDGSVRDQTWLEDHSNSHLRNVTDVSVVTPAVSRLW